MNNIYLYENTFLSLITLINYLLSNKIKPDNIKNLNYELNLLDNPIRLNLPIQKIPSYLKNYSYLLKTIYYVFLSNEQNKELIIYYLLLNYSKYQTNLLNMRNLNCVSTSLKISLYVSHEAHKFKGFTRFTELKNHVLYAKIEPTNNIITLITKHFKNRLKNEYFIIHDIKRGIISIYDQKRIYYLKETSLKIDTTKESNFYENLWCIFYQTTGVKERKNDRCRMNFMPKKYWKNILEVEEEI